MNKRDYLKFNIKVFDKLKNPIKRGDTVVCTSYYGSSPIIGKVDHITSSGRLAIQYNYYYLGVKKTVEWAYRFPDSVIRIKKSRVKSQWENI